MPDPPPASRPRRYPDVAGLLSGATERAPFGSEPGKSGARLERVIIASRRYVLKHLDLSRDWTLRASGCVPGAPLVLWQRGILDRLPDCISQPIVGVACEAMWGRRRTAVLMDDVGQWLIPRRRRRDPADGAPAADVPPGHPARDPVGARPGVRGGPEMHRYLELSPWTAQAEAAIGSDHLVPPLIDRGWRRLPQVAPLAAAIVGPPLRSTPVPSSRPWPAPPGRSCTATGSWTTWVWTTGAARCCSTGSCPGSAPRCSDLAWYLAINCRRLPQSKEAAIKDYRAALEAAGVDTTPWWDRQLALCLLGALVQFGWEKALGGYDDELAWWEDKAVDGARYLDHE